MARTAGRKAEGAQGGEAAEAAELGREAWALLFDVLHAQMRSLPAMTAEFELSPVQAHVLRMLGEEGPLPMSALAQLLSCDASNVTGLVDRLEGRGLLERQGAPHDRRVKLLALTEAGRELREKLLARLRVPPPPIAELDASDLRALRDIMRRALDNVRRDGGEPQSSRKV